MTATPETCPSCAADPKTAPGRYCAPKRCLCGHRDCPAFPTYVARREPAQPPVYAPPVPPRESSAWDDREEGSTWIDSM